MFARTFQSEEDSISSQTSKICKAALELNNSFASLKFPHLKNNDVVLQLQSAICMGPIVAGRSLCFLYARSCLFRGVPMKLLVLYPLIRFIVCKSRLQAKCGNKRSMTLQTRNFTKL